MYQIEYLEKGILHTIGVILTVIAFIGAFLLAAGVILKFLVDNPPSYADNLLIIGLILVVVCGFTGGSIARKYKP